ncbi:MAG: hypothetical protein SVR94_00975 [Pseudomonadota bacterium]|nr:hypothetical protein [Pseudomonadota bacterium]
MSNLKNCVYTQENLMGMSRFPRYVFNVIFLILLFLFSNSGWSQQIRPQLEWLMDGTLLVSQRWPNQKWLFEPKQKRFNLLPYSTEFKRINISLSGKKIIVYDEEENFRFGSILGPLSEPLPIPTWVVLQPLPSEDIDKYIQLNRQTRFFWISDKTLFVNQINHHTAEIKCRLFDISKKTWSQFIDNCISSNGAHIGRISRGLHDFLVVYSTAEGVLQVSIYKWTLEKGLQDIQFPDFNLYKGDMAVHFDENSSSNVYLTTPCLLERTLEKGNQFPCQGVSLEESAWRLYSWKPNKDNSPPILIKTDLPPFAIPSPLNHEIMAWPQFGVVCVGKPHITGAFVCTSIPTTGSVQ